MRPWLEPITRITGDPEALAGGHGYLPTVDLDEGSGTEGAA